MGYGNWGYGSMMNGLGSFGIITWLVLLVDLILVGIWLWQQISKK
jgi:cytoskeletal protein RodZ